MALYSPFRPLTRLESPVSQPWACHVEQIQPTFLPLPFSSCCPQARSPHLSTKEANILDSPGLEGHYQGLSPCKWLGALPT